jgi:asparagine synthase (glutamine-hydrolysing)
MCGIAGWVAFHTELTAEQRVIDAMTETLACRGPDSDGTWISGHAALGHRRLAVIDPPGGRQPMTVITPDGVVALTYSGEVYNFRELRNDLRRRGHRFTTSSDAEVVLHAYLEWGEALASRLIGIFAFAIWDTRRDALVMVRDRLGVKPLYYYPTRDGVLFASEPKGILANPRADRVVTSDGLRRMLAYAMTVPGVPWEGVREVEPGDIVIVDRRGIRPRPYWRLTTSEHVDGRSETVERVRGLLDGIVCSQLVADVPLGILLSGGLDSSTITAISARHLSDRVRTFAVELVGHVAHFVVDDERAAPDEPYIAEVVAALNTDHRAVVLDHVAIADAGLRASIVHAYDLPPGSGDRDRSLTLLFRAIREHATVVLSGESADELFGGYASFREPAALQLGTFPWVAACYDTYGLSQGAMSADIESDLDVPGYLRDQFSSAVSEVAHLDGSTTHERQMRVVSYLHLTRSLRVLLDRKDRLSMATGLEVRVPYCDHRLVEYVYNTPWSMKSFDGREKSLLRAAAQGLVPAAVLERSKSAYPSIRDPRYVEALRHQAMALAADDSNAVFAVVSRSWLRKVVTPPAAVMPDRTRHSLEWILNFAAWLDVCRVQLRLP